MVAVRHVNAADAPMLAAGSAGAAFYPDIALKRYLGFQAAFGLSE